MANLKLTGFSSVKVIAASSVAILSGGTAYLALSNDQGSTTANGVFGSIRIVARASSDSSPDVAMPMAPLNAIIDFAQTHVVPAQGISFASDEKDRDLHLIGNRAALAIVRLGAADAVSPSIEASRDGKVLGSVALAPPTALPATEGGGPAFATDAWTADLPRQWIVPGTQFIVKAVNYAPSDPVSPLIGADSAMSLRVLPFYLFGATEANTQPLSVVQRPDPAVEREIVAKWPVADLDVAPHPAGYVKWDHLVISPNGGRPAYVMTNSDQEQGGSELLGGVLGILNALQRANGDSRTNNAYYASLLPLGAKGTYRWSGGGLGTIAGGVGAGPFYFGGTFIHELGHGLGLGHAGHESNYPYPAGSLKGSAWGFDPDRRQFLSPLVPTTASNYKGCARKHQLDEAGRCFKQDPMQNGIGDQDPSYRFTMFSDFNVARMQRWLEGVTTVGSNGQPVFSGGRVFVQPDGYKRWNSVSRTWSTLPDDNTRDWGLYGVNLDLPVQRNVPVYAVVITYSLAGTPGVSQIYPTLRFTGNTIRTFDPTNAQDRADIDIRTGKYRQYCQNSGCDYTLRVTFSDGSVIHRILKDGFRSFIGADRALPARATDPTSDGSFNTWAINVPATGTISRIELLETPTAWRGMPAEPRVVLRQ
ncbi:M66 family metalloprotease [Sphingomonas floccifaciens]|uniref:M66 family metalloprotease n=1 Tax=Sphingomonas floccifaciens TaxID=1844115 RepID=A0ABW4NB90_9SPHN